MEDKDKVYVKPCMYASERSILRQAGMVMTSTWIGTNGNDSGIMLNAPEGQIKVPTDLRGFTLLEVMVVVVILGILAALVVPKIISRPDEARIIAAKQDIASLMQALKLYRLDNQRYPSSEQGLQALVAQPTTAPLAPNWKAGGYLDRLPRDPWGNPYQYLNPGVHGEIDVFSFGADGAPGGEGNDADIGSWSL
jgi:general secretion pathway protein G